MVICLIELSILWNGLSSFTATVHSNYGWPLKRSSTVPSYLHNLYLLCYSSLLPVAGLPPEKVIEAHGTFTTTSCISCKQRQEPSHVKDAIFMNKIPRCTRSGCMSLVKPDIVFFGEDLPRKFYYYLRDFPMADMLIVMGTSLEVNSAIARGNDRLL